MKRAEAPFRKQLAVHLAMASVLGVGLLRSPLAAQEKPATKPSALRLSGLVQDARTGAPIGGATVLIGRGIGVASAVTDSAGQYRVETSRVSSMMEQVRVFRTGFLPEIRYTHLFCVVMVARVGEPFYCDKSLSFELRSSERLFHPSESECSVEGRVLEEGGNPARGAFVEIPGESGGSVADVSGAFRLEKVTAGLRTMRVTTNGYDAEEKLVLVACSAGAASESVTFRMQRFAVE